MKLRKTFSMVAGWFFFAVAISPAASALNPLEIKGYKFFDSVTGDEVVIRGIDYYPRPNSGNLNLNSQDFYTDAHRSMWERDIPYLEKLGVNAIRLYAVDPDQTHDSFMCALDTAGIYVIVSMAHDCPTCAVTRDEAFPDGKCYPPELKNQGQRVIREFAKFPNTLAFSAGNEVNHFAPPGQPEWNAPCQKKFVRDMREYVDLCSETMRKIPIGLVAADSDRDENALYYNCQSDPDDDYEYAEWYGLNSYVTCNIDIEEYQDAKGLLSMQKSFESYNLSIPVLMTEFGCLSDTYPTVDGYAGQRNFLQAKWMLEEPQLHNIFAGGFAFEYSIEAANAGSESPYPFTSYGNQNYGIGYFSPELCDDIKLPCHYNPMPSYENLRSIYLKTRSANMTTKDEFSVPEKRTGHTPCPKQFPSLNLISWEADGHPFSECPRDWETSPACTSLELLQVEMIHHRRSIGGGTFLIFLFLLCYGLGAYRRYQRNSDYDEMKLNPSEDSNESTGLMSLMAFKGPLSRYHALDSNSSCEDFPSPY